MDPEALIEIATDAREDEEIVMQDGTPPDTEDVNVMSEWINQRVRMGRPFFRLNDSFSTFSIPNMPAEVVTINGVVHMTAYFEGRDNLSTDTEGGRSASTVGSASTMDSASSFDSASTMDSASS